MKKVLKAIAVTLLFSGVVHGLTAYEITIKPVTAAACDLDDINGCND